MGASPTDGFVRSDSPRRSPRDVSSLLPPSQAKTSDSLPFCSDFRVAVSHCADGDPVRSFVLASGTLPCPVGSVQMIAAHSRACRWASSFAREIFGRKKKSRHTGKPFGNSQACLQVPSPLWAVNLKLRASFQRWGDSPRTPLQLFRAMRWPQDGFVTSRSPE